MRRLVRSLRILVHYARIGVIRKSQFRLEFVNQVVMDVTFYLSHILTFEVLYGMTDHILGWRLEDVRVLLGFYFVSDAFMMIWLGQCWHFGDDLKKGNLDSVRVRPASPILIYFFQRFSLEGAANMVIAIGYLLYALAAKGVAPSFGAALVFLWAIALSCWARTVTMIGFTIFEFYFVNSDLGRLTHEFLSAASEKPLDIFARRVRQFFLYLVPMGVLAYAPAALALGRISISAGLLHTLWLVLLGLAVFRCWKVGFRRYESAMG